LPASVDSVEPTVGEVVKTSAYNDDVAASVVVVADVVVTSSAADVLGTSANRRHCP